MSEIGYMILAVVGGFLLGIIFFGGLWLTMKKVIASKMPGLFFSASFLIRAGITMFGFYYISLGHPQRLFMCLLGYIVARFFVLRITKQLDGKRLTGGQI